MKANLDVDTKRILVSLLASPKKASEVGRIHGIPVATVWQRIQRLQDLGLVREVLSFVDSSGQLRRYFEAILLIDMAEEEAIVEF